MRTTVYHHVSKERALPRKSVVTFGLIVLISLLVFDIPNYVLTKYALVDILGEFTFFGISWTTVAALVFCAIDFVAITLLLLPLVGKDITKGIYYVFALWFVLAAGNATLTWWGFSVALLKHFNGSVDSLEQVKEIPVIVSALVLTVRTLLMGTLALRAERIVYSPADLGQKN